MNSSESPKTLLEMPEESRDSDTEEAENDDGGVLYKATRYVVEAVELVVNLF